MKEQVAEMLKFTGSLLMRDKQRIFLVTYDCFGQAFMKKFGDLASVKTAHNYQNVLPQF